MSEACAVLCIQERVEIDSVCILEEIVIDQQDEFRIVAQAIAYILQSIISQLLPLTTGGVQTQVHHPR
jgi:hypothetical protein